MDMGVSNVLPGDVYKTSIIQALVWYIGILFLPIFFPYNIVKQKFISI